MISTIYVPRDSASIAVGSEQVVRMIRSEAAKRNIEVLIVRNGSRGMLWLEPLVEVKSGAARIAYGPVTPADVASLFEAGFQNGGKHRLCLGPTDEIAYLKRQERLTFARVGVTDPLSLEEYETYAGFRGLRKALTLSGSSIVQQVTESGLRGRGGAAFPTGVKWQTVLNTPSSQKYVVCNADEGDSGTFADRMLMEGDPFVLIEGMTIAGLAVGAHQGYVYVRSEYPNAISVLIDAISVARKEGFLGSNILGSGKVFELEVRKGAGSYVCGEETALLESLEGKRGIVRSKPPVPAVAGLFGRPTIVNNVLTLASVPAILERGPGYYKEFGTGRSRGTMAFQLAGNVRQGGLVEKAFGITLHELLYGFGGGSASGRPIKAVQVGGPLGSYLPESQWNTPLDYESFAAISAVLGHGGVVVHDDRANMAALARYAMKFCEVESCGKCTPCRIGATRGAEVIDRIMAGQGETGQIKLLRDLCDTMMHASMCAMGGMTPYPVLSALNHFPDEFSKGSSKRVWEGGTRTPGG